MSAYVAALLLKYPPNTHINQVQVTFAPLGTFILSLNIGVLVIDFPLQVSWLFISKLCSKDSNKLWLDAKTGVFAFYHDNTVHIYLSLQARQKNVHVYILYMRFMSILLPAGPHSSTSSSFIELYFIISCL